MKNIQLSVFLAILFIGCVVGAYFYGRSSVSERQVTVPATVNVDSLHDVWLQATVDSLTYNDLVRRYNGLHSSILRSGGHKLGHPDTIYIKGDTTGTQSEKIPVFTADTSIKVGVSGFVVQDGDTTALSDSTTISTSLAFIGDPYYLLGIEKLKIAPFTLNIPTKEKVIRTGGGLQITGLAGVWQGQPSGGGIIKIGRIGAGGVAIYKSTPLWLVSYDLVK